MQPLTEEEAVELLEILDKSRICCDTCQQRANYLITKAIVIKAMNELIDIFHRRREILNAFK